MNARNTRINTEPCPEEDARQALVQGGERLGSDDAHMSSLIGSGDRLTRAGLAVRLTAT